MPLKSPLNVVIEKPATSFAETLCEIRTWLDHNKIEPVEFKTLPVRGNGVALEIRFQHADEAFLFDRAFRPADHRVATDLG